MEAGRYSIGKKSVESSSEFNLLNSNNKDSQIRTKRGHVRWGGVSKLTQVDKEERRRGS